MFSLEFLATKFFPLFQTLNPNSSKKLDFFDKRDSICESLLVNSIPFCDSSQLYCNREHLICFPRVACCLC
jgi:hypothetical protein